MFSLACILVVVAVVLACHFLCMRATVSGFGTAIPPAVVHACFRPSTLEPVLLSVLAKRETLV